MQQHVQFLSRLWLCVLALLFAQLAQAQAPILTEDFTATTTPYSLISQGWATHSGATASVSAVTTNLTYAGLNTSGGSAQVIGASGSREDVNRAIGSSLSSGNVYASFLLNVSSAPAAEDYFLHLMPSASGSEFTGRIYFKQSGNGYQLGIARSSGSSVAVYAPNVLSSGTTYFIVIKYSFVSGATNDVASLFISPALNSTEGAVSASYAATTGADASAIANVALRQNTTTYSLIADYIRIGTTWASVTGGGANAPVVFVNPASLTGFSTTQGTASAVQTYALTGSNLTTAITVTAPSGYQVSQDGSTYLNTITVTPSGGSVNTNILVRLTGAAVGSPAGTISNSSGNTLSYVTVNGSVVVPALTAAPTALNGFSTAQGTASASQTYALTGSNLTADVTVTAPAGYQVSQDGATFQNAITVTQSGGSVNATISVRLTGASAGSPAGNVTNVSGSTSTNVAVSGTVSSPNSPSLSVTPNTLSGFSTTQGTASGTQTYALGGSNLTADVTVTAPAGYQVSQDGATFLNAITVTQSGGSVNATISVRLTGASAGSPAGNVTNVSGAASTNVAVSGTVNAPVTITLISQIQGSGSTAALTGTQTIEGIVTRTFFGATRLNGFYVQEEDADSDGNPATSEGIFVYDPSGFFTGNVGDKVRITGAVTEFTSTASGITSSLTEITLASANGVTSVSTSNSVPTVTNVQLPVANVSDLERYEGMLINMSAASGNLVATEYFQIARFGQVVLSATGATDQPGTDARLDQYTQFFAPSVSGYTAYLADIAKRRIILDDGSAVQNPDPIIFGRGGQPLSASNTLRGGDQVASITAVLDQRLEGYRLQTTNGADANFIASNPRSATPPVVNGTLKAGSFNVLNYFTDLDVSSSSRFTNCNGNSLEPRGAETSVEFTRQRDKVIRAILNSNVDVMSLNEMENNGFGTNSAIQDLINGLNAVAGANSFTFVNSGCISSDAITVAMIYKPSQVTPVGLSSAIPFAYGTGSFTSVGRRALAQTFQQNANGAVFTLVANHWKSKGSGSGSGDTDAGDGQSLSNGTRTRQAQDLVSWLGTNPTGTTDPDYLIVGDLNSYAQEDPLKTLEQGGYTNLVPASTYSYVFDGFVGALDHAFRSTSLQSQIAGADKWHINSDEPTALDYNTNFKSAGQINSLYSADPYRASDHDPVLIGLSLTSPVVAALTVTASASPTQILTTGSTTITATVTGGTTPYSYAFTGPGTITPNGNSASVSGLSAGVQTFTVTATDATTPTAQSSFTTVSVTVTTANTAPMVANAVGPQSATVGVSYTLSLANVFTDAETPNQLTLSANGLPMGLSLTGSNISGTPTLAGVSSVSLTATDGGGLSSSTTFTITVNPATTNPNPNPTVPFSITSVTLSACEVVTASERRVTITPNYAGVTGESIRFQVANETLPTTAPAPYTLRLYTDNPVISLRAVQGNGVEVSYSYNWLAACNSGTPPSNTAPTVANAVGPQSATVGVGYTLSLSGVFTDAETPNQLTLSAMNLPTGLSLTGSSISGTPTLAGVSSVSLTATDGGGLSSSTTFTITVNPATTSPNPNPNPTMPFSITSVTLNNCEVVTASERRVTITPNYAGVTGESIRFQVANETLPTTAAAPYTLRLYTDNPVISLRAVQGNGAEVSYSYNWLAACNGNTPPTPMPTNTAPTVANPVNPQSATVGVGYTLSLATVFTDAETPNQLSLSVSSLPQGLSLIGSSISGTPTVAELVTVSVTATDGGGLSSSTSFSLRVNPAAGTTVPFSISSVTLNSCEAVTASERRVTITPNYAGVSGEPIRFQVFNETSPTTAPAPYTLRLYTDNPVISLRAVQGNGAEVSLSYNWLAFCTTNGRVGATEHVDPLSVTVLGNPVVAETVDVEIRGADGQSVRIQTVDSRGHSISDNRVEKAAPVERTTVRLRQSAGVYLLQISTATQQQTIKLIRE